MRATLIATLAWLALAGCGPDTTVELDQRHDAIINGVPDTDPAHDAVVAVYRSHYYWGLCSGTMIAPNVVLTAAHCVDIRFRDDYEILFGPTGRESVRRRVTHIWVHPDYNDQMLGKSDLSLMRFSGSVPDGVRPIAHLPAELGLTRQDEGRPLQFSGFGLTEDGQISTKLTVSTPLTHVCDEAGSCLGLGFVNQAHTLCYVQTDVGGPCSGDSGGPAFLVQDNQEYVVGVTSYGDRSCRIYGCSIKVDAFQAWIDAFIAAEAELGEACQDDLECRSGFCADGLCCDYACNSPCEACDLAGRAGACSRVTDDALEPGCAQGGTCAGAGGAGGMGLGLGLLALLSALALAWRRT